MLKVHFYQTKSLSNFVCTASIQATAVLRGRSQQQGPTASSPWFSALGHQTSGFAKYFLNEL